jgi:hypothetical protein
MEALRVLNVDSLDIAIEFLLGAFFVVSFPGNSDSKSIWYTLHSALPNLLVQLWV